mmetsp:Transcript_20109/g.29188  ORF Transcript_20109/g.29188 Transcript_20109/m.29188 type:complete len:82 (-) Transcript_20109:600-845(-)
MHHSVVTLEFLNLIRENLLEHSITNLARKRITKRDQASFKSEFQVKRESFIEESHLTSWNSTPLVALLHYLIFLHVLKTYS